MYEIYCQCEEPDPTVGKNNQTICANCNKLIEENQ